MHTQKAFRGEILHFLEDPSSNNIKQPQDSYEYLEDGVLFVENGIITGLKDYATLDQDHINTIDITHYQDGLITPGFIDTHVHYPQTEMIASYGEQLLSWLENYTFPTEQQFSDYNYSRTIADFFLNQLIDNGTTTALVFGTVHPESVEAFFDAALARKLRMICGKVLMDRNAPDYLLDTPESAYQQSKELIEKWHGRERLQYAITPRFAPTSSNAQLDAASRLLKEYPSTYLHTHLCENKDEIDWVKQLFPESNGYLDVYDRHNLLGQRSVFAHGVHLTDQECQRLSDTNSAIAHCPSSNFFLGSGVFNLKQAETFNYHVGLGTDVGAGTSFSLLQTMNDAYKSQQLQGHSLSALKSFYLATLGGARALDLDNKIGSFLDGREADFIVLDYQASSLSKLRIARCNSIQEKLFVLSILGDDRTVAATHVLGERVK